jgi:hypothetical protein
VLGLADQVGRDVLGVGAVVGEDGDLGGSGLGVDADQPLDEPLGGGDIDVARSGDEGDRVATLEAMGETGDGLRTTHRIDLVNPQQSARREDGRMGPAVVIHLRWARHREGSDTGNLRGNHVHDHAARVDRQSPGDIEADPVHRHPSLGDRAATGDHRDLVAALLVGVDESGSADRLLQGTTDRGVELGQGPGQDGGRHAQAGGAHPVEAFGGVEKGLAAAQADVVADRRNR